MKENRLSVRLSDNRMKKLQEYAKNKDTTVTHLVEQWIDNLQKH